METENARQNAIQAQGPVEVFGREKPLPKETLAILNTMPPSPYISKGGVGCRTGRRNPCKTGSAKIPSRTEYDLEAPYITYRKFRSNRYKKNKGHMVVSGDRYVHCNLTRSYIFHRPPFDWYDGKKADILDDIEEVVPVAGTLGEVHTKDIYATPNFVGNHHTMNVHQNNSESESEDDYDESFANSPNYSTPNRPGNRVGSRPMPLEVRNDSSFDNNDNNRQPRGYTPNKQESRNLNQEAMQPRFIKNGNRSAGRNFSRDEEEDFGGHDDRSRSNVRSYNYAKGSDPQQRQSDEFREFLEYKQYKSLQNLEKINLDLREIEARKNSGINSYRESMITENTPVKACQLRNLSFNNGFNDRQVEASQYVHLKCEKRNEPTKSELSNYNHITEYVQSNPKLIKNVQSINQADGDVFRSKCNYKTQINKKMDMVCKKKTTDDVASQIIKDLMNVHMSDKAFQNCDVKYY